MRFDIRFDMRFIWALHSSFATHRYISLKTQNEGERVNDDIWTAVMRTPLISLVETSKLSGHIECNFHQQAF